MINSLAAAFFKQKRNVEQDQGLVTIFIEKSLAQFCHGRVNQLFESLQGCRIAKHRRSQLLPVNACAGRRSGEQRFDLLHQSPARSLQLMDGGIGIEQGNPFVDEHLRDGRFSHADRAGQADDIGLLPLHPATSSFLSSSSCSIGGVAPKNSSNASAAWPISMSRPSTTASSLFLAARSSFVSSGA